MEHLWASSTGSSSHVIQFLFTSFERFRTVCLEGSSYLISLAMVWEGTTTHSLWSFRSMKLIETGTASSESLFLVYLHMFMIQFWSDSLALYFQVFKPQFRLFLARVIFYVADNCSDLLVLVYCKTRNFVILLSSTVDFSLKYTIHWLQIGWIFMSMGSIMFETSWTSVASAL